MLFPTAACCAIALNQQQQQNIYHCNQPADDSSANCGKTKHKNYTVIEDGRVVVRPAPTPVNKAE